MKKMIRKRKPKKLEKGKKVELEQEREECEMLRKNRRK